MRSPPAAFSTCFPPVAGPRWPGLPADRRWRSSALVSGRAAGLPAGPHLGRGEVARRHPGRSGLRLLADGEWMVFWTGSELRKIRVSGGPSARICAAIQVTGLTWGPTRLVFTTRYQMFEVSPDGGTPRRAHGAGQTAVDSIPASRGERSALYRIRQAVHVGRRAGDDSPAGS